MFPASLRGGIISLYGPKQLAESIRTVRKNTILIAEDIHADDYGYRPVPGTVLSLLRCSKYPPSLLYLLMTLGPSLLLLASFENSRNWSTKRLQVFGGVPLFYYILHLSILHGIAVLFSYARYGRASFLFQDSFLFQRSANPLPAGYGYGLPVVYGVWLSVVLLLYPACRWYANVKRTHSHPILRYL